VLALLSGVVGWLLITWSLPRLPAAVSALLLLLEPVAALILAAIVLGQRPSLIQIAGAVLVCGGVLIVARSQEQRRGQAATADVAFDPTGLLSVGREFRRNGRSLRRDPAGSAPDAVGDHRDGERDAHREC
jgi:hypothetical protein